MIFPAITASIFISCNFELIPQRIGATGTHAADWAKRLRLGVAWASLLKRFEGQRYCLWVPKGEIYLSATGWMKRCKLLVSSRYDALPMVDRSS
jgi:hypothetical protein